jgi:rod shape-determining protein MreD
MRQDVKPTAAAVVATVAASSFVGTSIFALSGIVLSDGIVGIPDLLRVILVAVLWDVLLTPFVLPLVMAMFHRLEPARTT